MSYMFVGINHTGRELIKSKTRCVVSNKYPVLLGPFKTIKATKYAVLHNIDSVKQAESIVKKERYKVCLNE